MSEQANDSAVRCPYCQSENWTCWDERTETHRDKATGQEYDFPVGYMRCNDCGKAYTHDEFAGENIQDEVDEWEQRRDE